MCRHYVLCQGDEEAFVIPNCLFGKWLSSEVTEVLCHLNISLFIGIPVTSATLSGYQLIYLLFIYVFCQGDERIVCVIPTSAKGSLQK